VGTGALGCPRSAARRSCLLPGLLCAPPCPLWLEPLHFLFLKQILKRRPRIVRPQTRRSRSLLLPRHSDLIQLALIPLILLRNPLLHRLHALKPAPGIEIRTLLARMQLKPTLRTLPIHRSSLQQSPALCAPRHRTRTRQIERLRPERMVPLRWTALALLRRFPRLFPPRLTPRLSIAILIPMLPIFRHYQPSPSTRVLSPRCTPSGKYRDEGASKFATAEKQREDI
jgi:hypothetical protein